MTPSSDPATKADIERLDLRMDRLDQKIDRVTAEMIRRFDTTASKDDIAAIQGQLKGMTVTLDFISGKFRDQERTILVYDQILKDHRTQLADHEKRLRLGPTP